jgi:hypothetical protein
VLKLKIKDYFPPVFFIVVCLLFTTTVVWRVYGWVFPFGMSYPVLHCEETVLNLGQIPCREPFPCEFVVKNTGTAPLQIRSIRASCASCIIIHSYPTEPILPDESGTISLSLFAENLPGKVQKQFLIQSNDPKHPNVLCSICAEIISDDFE